MPDTSGAPPAALVLGNPPGPQADFGSEPPPLPDSAVPADFELPADLGSEAPPLPPPDSAVDADFELPADLGSEEPPLLPPDSAVEADFELPVDLGSEAPPLRPPDALGEEASPSPEADMPGEHSGVPDEALDPEALFAQSGPPLVRDLVRSLLELVDADAHLQDPPTDWDGQLLRIVVPQLREHLLAHAETFAAEIFDSSAAAIFDIWMASRQSRPNQEPDKLAKARAARCEKQYHRRERDRKAGERLTELRLKRAAEVSAAANDLEEEISPTPIRDEDLTSEEFECFMSPDRYQAYRDELEQLWTVGSDKKNRRRFGKFPISRQFAFLIASHSRPTLDISRELLPLPSWETVRDYYRERSAAVEVGLSNLDMIDTQIDVFIGGLPRNSVVSLANDAMAMNPAKTSLPAPNSEYMFVLYVHPLDRRYRCFPLHVLPHPSGRATEEVHTAIDRACEALTNRGLEVKFVCADGDQGYNRSHQAFFEQWYREFIQGGLKDAVEFAAGQSKFPVGDYLHLWKTQCSKVKNHLVVLSPDCLGTYVSVDELESLLQLGTVLTDKSSVGRMRDSYALKLFSLSNCIRCLDAEAYNEFMYLLPFALQEEVLRDTELPRDERLMRAILAFKLLMHFFELTCFPREEGVQQRWGRDALAVTFAEDSAWSRILNSALALVVFTLQADEHWSFSRMGSHCLENFFGLVRRSSLGDDRAITAMRIIVKATIVAEIMHDLGIEVHHRGRDNVGGVVISGDPPEWTEEVAESLCRSMVALSDLEMLSRPRFGVMTKEDLMRLLCEWDEHDAHHANDPAYNASFEGKNSNSRIPARIIPPEQGAPGRRRKQSDLLVLELPDIDSDSD
jgi:hypothetical protein